MNPPLRAADDRKSLLDAVRDGTISVIATDHAPHARHEKDVPFEEAPFGVTGLETAFASLNTHLVEPGLLTLPTLLERMSAGPARAYGLEPPRIEVGARANLVLLDTETTWRVGDGRLPLALRQLVAARPDAARQGAADGRRRPGGLHRHDPRLSRARGRDGLPRASRSAPRASAFGEAVFATAMTGYQELVTDPSYAEQILCFTAPMVGNYGVCKGRSESGGVHVQGVVMREAQGPAWTDWLRENGVVALDGIDTRSLVLHLRDRGSMWAAIGTGRRDSRGGGRDGGPGRWSRRSRRPSRTSTPSTVGCGSRSSTTGRSARSCGGSPAPASP